MLLSSLIVAKSIVEHFFIGRWGKNGGKKKDRSLMALLLSEMKVLGR